MENFEGEKLKDAVHMKNLMQTMQNSQGIASMHEKSTLDEQRLNTNNLNVFTSANVD